MKISHMQKKNCLQYCLYVTYPMSQFAPIMKIYLDGNVPSVWLCFLFLIQDCLLDIWDYILQMILLQWVEENIDYKTEEERVSDLTYILVSVKRQSASDTCRNVYCRCVDPICVEKIIFGIKAVHHYSFYIKIP